MTRVTDVHTEHCCVRHGCKYDWHQIGECTVTSGEKRQSFPCEYCVSDISEIWDIVHLENRIHNLEWEVARLRVEVDDAYWDGYHKGRADAHEESP